MDPELVRQQFAEREAGPITARLMNRREEREAAAETMIVGENPRTGPPRVEQTPRRARRDPHDLAAEKALGHVFVCLVAYFEPVPRYFGDNRGTWPVRVEMHGDWRQGGKQADQAAPVVPIVRLAVVGVPSAVHGRRLKAALDEMLLGRARAEDTDDLRYSWRDAVDFGEINLWWPALLADALIICEAKARDFEVFDVREHERRVAMAADKLRMGRRL